jgi:nucleoside-diphosphate-sugar epimerase
VSKHSLFKGRRILIAGGSGFIGRSVTNYLLKQAAEVVWIVKNKPKSSPKLKVYEWEQFIKNSKFKSKFTDLIIATNTSLNKDFPHSAKSIFETHVSAPIQLLNWSRENGVKHVIHFSSGSVYSFDKIQQPGIISSKTPQFFLTSKFAMDLLAQEFSSHLTIQIIRLFRPYGPSQGNTLINQILKSVVKGQILNLTKPDGPQIQPIHLDDISLVVSYLLNSPKSCIIDLAGRERMTLGELARKAGRIFSVQPKFKVLSQKAEHDRSIRTSGIPAIDRLITTPINNGLRSMSDFLKEHTS